MRADIASKLEELEKLQELIKVERFNNAAELADLQNLLNATKDTNTDLRTKIATKTAELSALHNIVDSSDAVKTKEIANITAELIALQSLFNASKFSEAALRAQLSDNQAELANLQRKYLEDRKKYDAEVQALNASLQAALVATQTHVSQQILPATVRQASTPTTIAEGTRDTMFVQNHTDKMALIRRIQQLELLLQNSYAKIADQEVQCHYDAAARQAYEQESKSVRVNLLKEISLYADAMCSKSLKDHSMKRTTTDFSSLPVHYHESDKSDIRQTRLTDARLATYSAAHKASMDSLNGFDYFLRKSIEANKLSREVDFVKQVQKPSHYLSAPEFHRTVY